MHTTSAGTLMVMLMVHGATHRTLRSSGKAVIYLSVKVKLSRCINRLILLVLSCYYYRLNSCINKQNVVFNEYISPATPNALILYQEIYVS